MREPLLWFTFRDAARRVWRVFLASEANCADLRCRAADCDYYDGRCDHEKRRIYINAKLSRQEQDLAVFHEMGHASIDSYVVAHEVPKPTEERHVDAVTGGLFPLCVFHGLKWPARPKGYRSLHIAAKKGQ